MGKKHPDKGSSFPNSWHIPGGGVDKEDNVEGDEERTLKNTAIRETAEEVGLVLGEDQLGVIGDVGHGESERTLPNGEIVVAEMDFHRHQVRLDQNASDIRLPESTEEFAELRWFTGEELSAIEQIPGGREFFISQGYQPE